MAVMDPVESPGLRQRRNALHKANEVKQWRMRERQGMTARRAIDLILRPEPLAETWEIRQVIQAVPQIGGWKRDRMLAAAWVSADTPLKDLSDRERLALVVLLRFWAHKSL
jgi:hypothetical protein